MSIAERALEIAKQNNKIANELYFEADEEDRAYLKGVVAETEFTLKAVAKQIPVSILVGLLDEERDPKLMRGIFRCPICGNAIKRDHHYCDWCGQALKWEE